MRERGRGRGREREGEGEGEGEREREGEVEGEGEGGRGRERGRGRGRESHEKAGEKPARVGWTCGKNGRGWRMRRADTLRVEGRRRRGRPRLRWEDCVKRFGGSGERE